MEGGRGERNLWLTGEQAERAEHFSEFDLGIIWHLEHYQE